MYVDETIEWWTKDHSGITTLEACLERSGRSVMGSNAENRQAAIDYLQAKHAPVAMAAGPLTEYSDAELIEKCALALFADRASMHILTNQNSLVTLQPTPRQPSNVSWWWQDTQTRMNMTGAFSSAQKVVDGDRGSGWVLVLQISQNRSGLFHYDSDLWTNDDILNAEYTNITSGIDVKLPSYSTQPLTAVRLCVSSLDNCFTLDVEANSSKELFSKGYQRREDLDQRSFERLFDADDLRADYSPYWPSQCMQRPGFNTECNGGNKARLGFCGNAPGQICQPGDDNDADFAIGLGLSGQSLGGPGGVEYPLTTMGAGYSDFFVNGIPGGMAQDARSFQAWFFVLAPGSDIENEPFPPPAPSYLHASNGTCSESVWIQIDLEQQRLVGGLHRWLYFADRSYCGQKVELSQTGTFDGEQSIVFACTSYVQCGQETASGKRIDFEPVQARYVRFYIGRNDLDEDAGHVAEIEVYGWAHPGNSNFSKFSSVRWGPGSMLVLNVSKTISAGEGVVAVIPSVLGVTLPINGIRHNQSSIGIATDAALGPVAVSPLTPVTLTMAVGSFGRTQRFDATPRRAGSSANITLSFSPHFP